MRLRTLKIALFFSLALLVVTAGAWVLSYDALAVHPYEGNLVLLYIGDNQVHPRDYEGGERAFFRWMEESLVIPGPEGVVETEGRVLGVRWVRVWQTVALHVPFAYLIVIPLALCAAVWLRLRRQQRRERAGLCLRCGYDLRHATGVCPECGTAAAAAIALRTRTIAEDGAREADPEALPTAVAAAPRDAGGERLRESQRTL